MKHSRLLSTIALGLGLTLALLWALQGPSGPVLAQNSLVSVDSSLTRQDDPVVIVGSSLPDLTGEPLNEIFVYAYQGITPTQIPFQIDERDAGGMYVAAEDGQLDDNDELVFMAMDAGAWADSPSLDVGGTAITPTYVITLTDPISDTRAWAYVFCLAPSRLSRGRLIKALRRPRLISTIPKAKCGRRLNAMSSIAAAFCAPIRSRSLPRAECGLNSFTGTGSPPSPP